MTPIEIIKEIHSKLAGPYDTIVIDERLYNEICKSIKEEI